MTSANQQAVSPDRSAAKLAQKARAEVRAMIGAMKPGQMITYHRGFLMDDRESDVVLAATANEYLAATESFRGYLLQRRISEGQYEYIFVRSDGIAS